MPSLLETFRALPEAIRRVDALSKMSVRVGGQAASRLDFRDGQANLVIGLPDLLRVLPNGAQYSVVISNTAPTNVQTPTIWFNSSPAGVASTMATAPMFFMGQLVLNQYFGNYNAQAATTLLGAAIYAQTAPTGADAQFTLWVNGAQTGMVLDLPAGTNYTYFPLNQYIAQGSVVQAQITQIGSTIPGSYITIGLDHSP
jgi:hypothetical protein